MIGSPASEQTSPTTAVVTRRSSPELAQPYDFTGLHIYFIGIGGCGMSGLARMLRARGAVCDGSDNMPSPITEKLRNDNFEVNHDQTEGTLPEQCSLVVASAAIKPDHPELLAAQRRGIEVISYAEALGLAQQGRTGVSIAGTHGKSTATAMLAHVLTKGRLNPSFIVGAQCPQIGGGSRVGGETIAAGPLIDRPGIMLCEACEFNRSFHHHRPSIGLINNIEEDHLDVYGSLEAIIEAFREFVLLLPDESAGGRLLIAHDNAHRREVCAGARCRVETFGFNPAADYQVVYEAANRCVELRRQSETICTWTLTMPGEHNALNSAAAALLGSYLGVDWSGVSESLSSFVGLERRTQRLGERSIGRGRIVVYDDYGHHPTEIENTLRALRSAENPQRLVCVFQPHQHSRTRFLLEQFAASFSHADVVIVPHIYFVRDSEVEKQKVSAADLVDRLRRCGVQAMHLYPFEAIVEQLEVMCRDNDLVVIMGAGPVWQIGRKFLRGRS